MFLYLDISGIHSCTVQAPRRTFHGMDNLTNTFLDDDDNKYRRRTPSDWLNRWTKWETKIIYEIFTFLN
jgi:hypothetical protein